MSLNIQSLRFWRYPTVRLRHHTSSRYYKTATFGIFRYDIKDGAMKIVNKFTNAESTVYATSGELFGEINLHDYLVMDEVAGQLINRSVKCVILRLKMENFPSQRAYECNIELKTFQSVTVKLNEELCEDFDLAADHVVQIDLKFRYNRRPMCEMHEAIDMCKQRTDILLPSVKSVSYKDKVSNVTALTEYALLESMF